MHLVRYDDEPPSKPPAWPNPTLEISIREPETGRVLAQIVLRLSSTRDSMGSMQPLSPGTPGAGTDARSIQPIAGRIVRVDTALDLAIDSWLDYLRARGKKPRSIAAFRQVVERAARELGWSAIADITFESVTTWLGAKAWKGTTYNRNLSVFRSMTRYLAKSKKAVDDPLEAAERAHDDGGDGARAATVDEARRVILRAWIRDQADRRCKGNRALYWLCLFASACRLDEPARWKRRHVILVHEHPHVLWTQEINKNHKRQEVALTPELAGLLREHLLAVDRSRAEAGLPPAGPDDPVFPTVPSKGTFVKDRDAAGIAAQDYRGRSFSPHSARKFFSTALTAQGVPEKMVDRLMRHSGRVEHRYYDPPLADQAAAMAKLPLLWPAPAGPVPARPVHVGASVGNFPRDLTKRGHHAEDGAGTPVGSPKQPNSTDRPGPVHQPPECQRRAIDTGLGREVEQLMWAAGQGRPEESGTVEADPVMSPALGIVGSDRAGSQPILCSRRDEVGLETGRHGQSGEVAERLKAAVC